MFGLFVCFCFVYSGFNITELPDMGVATGNWGCGAFMGYKPLKAIIQVLAASEADRPLVLYSLFGDVELMECLKRFLDFAHAKSMTVGILYRQLLAFVKASKEKLPEYEASYTFIDDFIASFNTTATANTASK